MKAYVIVSVTYDWYRFQDNLAVCLSHEEAMRKAHDAADGLSVYEYPEGSDRAAELNGKEKRHIWIEEFRVINEVVEL